MGPATGTLGLMPAATVEGPTAMEPAEGPTAEGPEATGQVAEGPAVEGLRPWRTRGLKE